MKTNLHLESFSVSWLPTFLLLQFKVRMYNFESSKISSQRHTNQYSQTKSQEQSASLFSNCPHALWPHNTPNFHTSLCLCLCWGHCLEYLTLASPSSFFPDNSSLSSSNSMSPALWNIYCPAAHHRINNQVHYSVPSFDVYFHHHHLIFLGVHLPPSERAELPKEKLPHFLSTRNH